MITYECIKEYPGGPKLGTIFTDKGEWSIFIIQIKK